MGFFFEQKGKPSTKISSVPPFPNPQKKKNKPKKHQSNEIMSGMIPKIEAVSVLLLLATGCP